jgi:hypothetical protein
MAKAFFLLLLSIGIIGLASTDKPNRPPFQIQVVDERTGIGVGNLRVVTDNGIACYTRANGDVFWGESSLMDRDVRFQIKDAAGQFDAATTSIRVTHGGQVELKLHRRKISF